MVRAKAYHALPQAAKFSGLLKKVGLDVHNPVFGASVDKASHQGWSNHYNKVLETFIQNNPKATHNDDVLDFARSLADKYGFECSFGGGLK